MLPGEEMQANGMEEQNEPAHGSEPIDTHSSGRRNFSKDIARQQE
jgi:hypothetical protein